MSERNRNFVLILFGIPALVGCLVAYKLYEGLYNEILEPRDVRQLNVEEVPGTHPTILNISIQPFSSALFCELSPQSREVRCSSCWLMLACPDLLSPNSKLG